MNDKIAMPNNVSEFTKTKDGKKIKSVAFKFKFPDGDDGVLTITSLGDPDWSYKDINSITIDYADNTAE